jgi:hypothetical protein
MKTRLLTCSILLATNVAVFALEPIRLVEPSFEPAYLVPVNPENREYEVAIQKLLAKRWGNGTMIYTESTYDHHDFVVSVWGKDHPRDDNKHFLHNFITVIDVAPSKNRTGAVRTKEIDIAIDEEFAIAVQRAWAAMLLKTRYPTNPYLGLDGSQTEFSVWVGGAGTLYGQLWSPSEGFPKELMDIGFALADYCRTPESGRPEKRNQLMRSLQDFEKRVTAIHD